LNADVARVLSPIARETRAARDTLDGKKRGFFVNLPQSITVLRVPMGLPFAAYMTRAAELPGLPSQAIGLIALSVSEVKCRIAVLGCRRAPSSLSSPEGLA
jgi:hypothetical protein